MQAKRYQGTGIEKCQTGTVAFGTVVRPISDVENATTGGHGVIWMLQYGSPDLEKQDTIRDVAELFIEHESFWETHEELFQLLQCVREREGDMLNRESRHLLAKKLLQCRITGCSTLRKAEKEAFGRDKVHLEKLCQEMQRNLAQ